MKSNHILYTLLFLALISCTREESPKEQFLKWAQKGKITDNIQCKIDPSLTYCVFIPKSYDVSKTYPTIYAFDPHGSGRIPANLMKSIADSLGYIVIGSNNSKNGISAEEINRIVNTLFDDSQTKLAIDPSSIYLVGFSGGARVACMIAQNKPGIKGVIACSAGFQPTKNPLGFRYIGIAGTQDMNYLEVRQLNALMDSVGIENQFIVFDGKHRWPNQAVMDEAITILTIKSLIAETAPKVNSIAKKYQENNLSKAKGLMNTQSVDSLAKALDIAIRTQQTVEEVENTDELKSIIEVLVKNQQVQKYLKEKVTLEKYEFKKQREFELAYGSKSDAWWNSEIKKLNDNSTGVTGNMHKRLLGFISLSCYGNVNGALYYQDWKAAQYFVSIYTQVDPENPDAWYALACLQANTAKQKEAIESLNSAIRLGFTNYSKIQNDPLLMPIRGLDEYQKLIKK